MWVLFCDSSFFAPGIGSSHKWRENWLSIWPQFSAGPTQAISQPECGEILKIGTTETHPRFYTNVYWAFITYQALHLVFYSITHQTSGERPT